MLKNPWMCHFHLWSGEHGVRVFQKEKKSGILIFVCDGPDFQVFTPLLDKVKMMLYFFHTNVLSEICTWNSILVLSDTDMCKYR